MVLEMSVFFKFKVKIVGFMRLFFVGGVIYFVFFLCDCLLCEFIGMFLL